MLRARIASLCVAVAAVTAAGLSSATAAEAAASKLPDVHFQIKSLQWEPRTGNVMVSARVKCTGKGSFRWEVGISQKVRARASSNVPCDGDGFVSTLELDPRNGRFHPGAAQLSRGVIICGGDVCIGTGSIEKTRIPPPGHSR